MYEQSPNLNPALNIDCTLHPKTKEIIDRIANIDWEYPGEQAEWASQITKTVTDPLTQIEYRLISDEKFMLLAQLDPWCYQAIPDYVQIHKHTGGALRPLLGLERIGKGANDRLNLAVSFSKEAERHLYKGIRLLRAFAPDYKNQIEIGWYEHSYYKDLLNRVLASA